MSLTTRLSLFFLLALGVVLVGFSATLYLLARSYLQHQAEERLLATLDTLAAATEIENDGVKWEPADRQIHAGRGEGEEEVRWQVADDQGQVKDHSANLGAHSSLFAGLPTDASAVEPLIGWQGQSWRVARRRVEPDPQAQAALVAPNQHEGDRLEPKYRALVLTAAASLEPMGRALRNLAFALVGLSLGLWLVAALLGRWLCRRALAPVTAMAATARGMSPAALDQRLPAPGTADELEDLSRSFNDLLSRLQESFERQRRFTGDASHQLRTPLTAMLGQIEVALRRERPPDEYRRVLGLVRGQADRLRRLVEMLLFLARADAEARLPHLEILDLGPWLGDQLRSWSEHPRAGDLRLETGTGQAFCVEAEPALLGQLVENLLDNACKHSEPGTPITLRLQDESGQVILSVEDAGCGITAEELPHVFEPFYRSPRSRQRGLAGLGLGLAIAQRIAVSFGAWITVASPKHQGARFEVHFPRCPTEPGAAAASLAGQESPSPAECR